MKTDWHQLDKFPYLLLPPKEQYQYRGYHRLQRVHHAFHNKLIAFIRNIVFHIVLQ